VRKEGEWLDKIKKAEIILLAISALIAAAMGIIKFIKVISKL
jgi:hypothetical protein